MTTRTFPHVRLSDARYKVLARMPLTSGSAPHLSSMRQRQAFEEMATLGLIIGYPGCFSVKWGWLSVSQSKRLAQYRALPYATLLS